MALLSLSNITVGFGGPPLLDGAALQIEPGERVCLLGRNGTGKSTLMKVIAGEMPPDSGRVFLQSDKPVARLGQEVPEGLAGTVGELVAGTKEGDHPDWERQNRLDRLLPRLELDPEARVETLSAGLKRRVMLAHRILDDPALLLLDEPTNHLDIESIAWLEEFLLSYPGALLFVTHDRAFLRRLATRIVELDRGKLTGWACDYDTFLERREAILEAEAKQEAAFDKKLAKEEAWLRRGIKARRTRNEGRVRSLLALREERRSRRSRTGQVQMQAQEAPRSGDKVIDAENVTFGYEGVPLIRSFSTVIYRGDKIGIIGPNGSGKSTLLRLLLGQLEPQSGSVRHGTRPRIAFFDQLREQLDSEASVRENLAGGSDTVEVNGVARHVISYLQDFLFPPDRAQSPVKSLSGGERNRLLLARLFTRPANLLVLDEPTNDLDMETLGLLEDLLVDYSGTLLLVSHDRAFLENVVTGLFALEGDGLIGEYSGGYDDYLRLRPAPLSRPAKPAKAEKNKPLPPRKRERKFTNRERRELEALPEQIETLEKEQHELAQALADPALYQSGGGEAAPKQTRMDEIEAELATAYRRWEELEALRETLEGPPSS